MIETSDTSWDKWKEHVLAELKRSNDNHLVLASAVSALHVEIAKLQVKSGVWGVVGGAIGGIAPVLIAILLHKIV